MKSNQVYLIKPGQESEQLRTSEKVSLLFFDVYSFMYLFKMQYLVTLT